MNTYNAIEYLKNFVKPERFDLFQKILDKRTRYVSLLIENVYQTHNASAIVRTAEAFGLQDVYVYERKNTFSPNEEISLGAQKWINLYKFNEKQDELKKVVEIIKEKKYRIIATSLYHKAINIYDLDIEKGKMLFLFGTEKEGLSEEICSYADEFVKIPMEGFTESFNVSVSVGIILSEINRRLRLSNIAYQLTEEEKNEILLQWLIRSIPMGEQVYQRWLKQR